MVHIIPPTYPDDTSPAGLTVEREQCATRAVLLPPPDQPMYEDLVDLTDEQRKALPARFHTPVFDGLGQPNLWLCQVCWGDGWVSQWPCGPAQEKGAMVFVSEGAAEDIAAELNRLRARVVELENALAATGRSLSSFIFDSDDPGVDALGAQWLYGQAMPQADDPFAQPRAFRSSVFSEAAKAVEDMDGDAPADRRQPYLEGYSAGLLDAAEHLETLADQAAEGSESTAAPSQREAGAL